MTITPNMLNWYKDLPFEKWVRFVSRNKNSKQLRRLQTMVLADYSDMEQEIQETPDQAILPRGTEAKLRVIAVYPGQNEETEVRYYRILFDIPDMPEVKEIQRFFNDLADGDKMLEKHFMAAKRAFRDFAKAFGLDYSKPFDWEEDLVGLEGDCILGVKKDEEYGDSNTISRFVTGK